MNWIDWGLVGELRWFAPVVVCVESVTQLGLQYGAFLVTEYYEMKLLASFLAQTSQYFIGD
jgi:hypothetical protein